MISTTTLVVIGLLARVIESISDWAGDKARENPGCVERFICETYKTGETMNGLPYIAMSLTK